MLFESIFFYSKIIMRIYLSMETWIIRTKVFQVMVTFDALTIKLYKNEEYAIYLYDRI